MSYLVYGAGGMLAVLMLLAAGAFLGWRASDAFGKYSARRAAEEATEEQLRQLAAQQQAFESMLSYNQNTAYGLDTGLSGAEGGEIRA